MISIARDPGCAAKSPARHNVCAANRASTRCFTSVTMSQRIIANTIAPGCCDHNCFASERQLPWKKLALELRKKLWVEIRFGMGGFTKALWILIRTRGV